MLALIAANGRAVVQHDRPAPVLAPGEALVRVTRAGICSTDVEVVRGYRAFTGVLGHEFTGVVVSAPDSAWAGRRVVGEINVGCGECATCRREGPEHCERRAALGIFGHDGAFAEFVALPQANLHAVPDHVPDDAAVFVEPLAAACELAERIHVRPAMRVVVLGAGRLGLLCAQVLALTGCDLTVVARRAATRALLAEWGIDAEADTQGLARACDLVVEATGSAAGFELARTLARPRGTLALKSTFHGLATVDLSAAVVDELVVAGTRCGPFDAALRLLAAGRVQVTPLIHARFPLAQGEAAFARAQEPGTLKVLLEI
jgi:threonine dehydrogenase-like Zn-dependent dehydrogenase